jgi:hypothetical protein
MHALLTRILWIRDTAAAEAAERICTSSSSAMRLVDVLSDVRPCNGTSCHCGLAFTRSVQMSSNMLDSVLQMAVSCST